MTTLLERFIPEAREHLEGAAAGLLKLERDASDAGLVNEVFRAVHTLKGASGLFDIPGLTRLVHAGEDLLGAVRSHISRWTRTWSMRCSTRSIGCPSGWTSWNGMANCQAMRKALR